MSDIRLGLQILPGNRFRVILEGGIEDIYMLETEVFQPEIADQLATALEAKVAEKQKEENRAWQQGQVHEEENEQ